MDLELTGKNALVCASSKGLGFAVAKTLADEGCHIFMCARDAGQLEEAARELKETSRGKVAFKAVDLAVFPSVRELADSAEDALGGIDILVNNVGGPKPTASAETSAEEWQKGFEQIFMSSTLLSQRLLPHMIKQKFGRIITITSISVVEPIENLSISTSMRAAVTAYSKSLSTEVAAQGVTVNTVMPGVIYTQRIEYLRQEKAKRQGTTLAEEMSKTNQSIPSGRMGKPEELANAIAFLASPKASYITGVNLGIDGGLRRGWN